MTQTVNSVTALEACLGKTPKSVNMKVIDHLDDCARRWLSLSPLAFVAFGDVDAVAITIGGGGGLRPHAGREAPDPAGMDARRPAISLNWKY